MRNPGGCTKVG